MNWQMEDDLEVHISKFCLCFILEQKKKINSRRQVVYDESLGKFGPDF